MAKIIYAVAGEGFGHSSRSHLIGQRLIDAGHDFVFVGSKKSLLYLKQYFVSVCMYLKKKMLLLPLAGQYEQIINAHYVQKLGLGISVEKLDEAVLSQFLDELDKPIPSDKRIIWPDNNKFFRILQEVLNRLHAPISIALH